jgi:hypothetical protein
MTHPIIPPPELVQQWADMLAIHTDTEVFSAAAQWGSDQELEACCLWLNGGSKIDYDTAALLRAARRKPSSLKEQALDVLHLSFDRGYLKEEAADTIRRALEQLPDNE